MATNADTKTGRQGKDLWVCESSVGLIHVPSYACKCLNQLH